MIRTHNQKSKKISREVLKEEAQMINDLTQNFQIKEIENITICTTLDYWTSQHAYDNYVIMYVS